MLSDPNAVRYNDLPAVAYALDSTLFDTQDFYVTIETHSPLTRGQTVADRRSTSGHPPNVKVCTGVEGARLAALFTERVTTYQHRA
jgi:inosine-uridine nucleoside N-ribohydrolase